MMCICHKRKKGQPKGRIRPVLEHCKVLKYEKGSSLAWNSVSMIIFMF